MKTAHRRTLCKESVPENRLPVSAGKGEKVR